MKKVLLICFLLAVFSPLSGGYFDDKGWISGWKFSPLQLDVGLVKDKKLFENHNKNFVNRKKYKRKKKNKQVFN